MERKLPKWCKTAKKKLIDIDTTETELAKAIGLNRSYVVSVLNGRQYSPNIVKKISDYLNIPDAYD